jgi:hypothetical protein
MNKLLSVIQNASGGCGSSQSTGCGTCSTAAPEKITVTRRDLGAASLGTAAAILAGCSKPGEAPRAEATAQEQLTSTGSPDLDLKQQAKGPVMTVLEEFYKVGPGPSSSHTIGPMRITYDFYQRYTKPPADRLARVTGMNVNLFGSNQRFNRSFMGSRSRYC